MRRWVVIVAAGIGRPGRCHAACDCACVGRGGWGALARGCVRGGGTAVRGCCRRVIARLWAVGWTGEETRPVPVAAHWDGRSLRVRRPFAASVNGSLTGVAARTPNDVWAVGSLNTADPFPLGLRGVIVHWDGLRWRRVVMPLLAPGSDLADVTTTSSRDVWVAGSESVRLQVVEPADVGWVTRPLLLHWDGRNWHHYDVSGLVLQCPSLEATGSTPPLEWFWTCGTGIEAIDSGARNDVWAAGTNDAVDFAGYDSVVLHWDGARWTRPRAPIPENTEAADAEGVQARDIDSTAPGNAWSLERVVDPAVEWEFLLIRRTDGERTRVRISNARRERRGTRGGRQQQCVDRRNALEQRRQHATRANRDPLERNLRRKTAHRARLAARHDALSDMCPLSRRDLGSRRPPPRPLLKPMQDDQGRGGRSEFRIPPMDRAPVLA